MEAISLYQLHQHIRRVVALNFPEAVFLKAEIVRVNESRGHFYLEVADKDTDDEHVKAKAQAVIWKNRHIAMRRQHKELLDELLQEGIKVAFHARVDFHEVYGLKLMIEEIDVEYTLGAVAQERTAIIERLTKEGLLDQNKQIPLPLAMQRIAVISSETAAGYGDFVNTLQNNSYGIKFFPKLFPAAMQGVSVEAEVLQQLATVEEQHEAYDAIVIIRGGGGKLDLAYFDNYKIGKGIAQSSLPVITGIGHQIDQTVTDLVAHTSVKTPTAAAEFLIDRNLAFFQILEDYQLKIERIANKAIEKELWTMRLYKDQLKSKAKQIIRAEEIKLDHHRNRLKSIIPQIIRRENTQLDNIQAQIRLMNPQNIFERGFTAIEQKGKRIAITTKLNPEDEFYIHFSDGRIKIDNYETE